jgi:hypothetical protein
MEIGIVKIEQETARLVQLAAYCQAAREDNLAGSLEQQALDHPEGSGSRERLTRLAAEAREHARDFRRAGDLMVDARLEAVA